MLTLESVLDRVFTAPKIARGLLAFARSLCLPQDGGPHAGERYDPDMHPAHLALLTALDSPAYQTVVAVGPVQDGKTWASIVIPWLYAMVDRAESVAVVLPTKAKIASLWQTKILPAVHGNGFTDLLPLAGSGSEGATPDQIHLQSGGHSHQLSTGTSNEAGLASITVRWVFASEVDDIDPPRRLDLAFARANAWGLQGRRVEDSTIKHDKPGRSRILRDYAAGTASRLHFACPHCGAWQTWEWARVSYDATSEDTAMESARLACRVGCLLTDDDRRRSLLRHRLVHRDQVVADDGQVVGTPPASRVYSLRWTALDSPLKSLQALALAHRAGVLQRDTQGIHDALRQFHRDELTEIYSGEVATDDHTTGLTAPFLAARSHAHGWALATAHKDTHGVFSRHIAPVPPQVRHGVASIDVQKNRVYWLITGEDADRRSYDIAWGYEYGSASQEPLDLHALHEVLDRTAVLIDELADAMVLRYRGIDVGYNVDWIIPWLTRSPTWVPVVGSDGDHLSGAKKAAFKSLPGVVHLYRPATDWRLNRLLHAIDVNRLRERVQGRYLIPPEQPGAALLPRGCESNGILCRHLVAEEQVETAAGNRVWRKAKGGGRHDLLDLRVYNEALLELARPKVAEIPVETVKTSNQPRPRGGWLNGF